MDKLPIEVYIKIISYLKYAEKVELLQVCRFWRNCIHYSNLYNHISTKGKARFQKAMSFLGCEELYSRQVHRLKIVKSEIDFPTLLELPSVFPHLEELLWEDYHNNQLDIESITQDIQKQLEHWKKLKSITETNRYLYTPLLLKTGSLPLLTKLCINLHFNRVDVGKDLIEHLNHAPHLKYFDITQVFLTLQQIELLHDKLPELEVLRLTALTQVTDETSPVDSDQQLNIQPALKLHTLYLERASFSGVSYGISRQWLEYISLKYTNMINFTITGVGMGNNPQPYYETGLTRIAEKCHKIQNYVIKIFPLTPVILRAMDTSEIQLKMVEVMSDGTGQDQLIDISNSGQKEYLQSISVTSFSGGDSLFQVLREFPQLRELDISSTANIMLNTSLKQLPQLERLSLSSMDISIDSSDTAIVPLKLKSIALGRVIINTSGDVLNFIAASAPLLSTLSIHGHVSDKNMGPLKVHFPSHYFEFIKVYILGNLRYRFKNGSHTTWFSSRGKIIHDCPKESPDGFKDEFYVSILCKGHSTLQIGSTVIGEIV